jgi:hypothetical protein
MTATMTTRTGAHVTLPLVMPVGSDDVWVPRVEDHIEMHAIVPPADNSAPNTHDIHHLVCGDIVSGGLVFAAGYLRSTRFATPCHKCYSEVAA